MLNFTKEKLYVGNQNLFYYDRFNPLLSVKNFSNPIHQDLKDYLGIQRELKQREKMSQAITNQQKRFDNVKMFRIQMFYDYYVDQVLQMMQMLYFENFQMINEGSRQTFLDQHKNLFQTGLLLQKCFDGALKICEDIKIMIEKQIKIQFPIETFQDKFIKK